MQHCDYGILLMGGLSLIAIAMSRCSQDDDIRMSPVVAAAIEKARSVAPGQMVRTVFSAYDTADLIGLKGASFIIKLPDSAPESNCVYNAVQGFVNGKEDVPLNYRPRYIEGHREETRCWLIDVAVLPDVFSRAGSPPRVAFFGRFKSLDKSRQWGSFQGRPPDAAPEDPESDAHVAFAFHAADDSQIAIANDIPIACWFQCSAGVKYREGPLGVAKTSPLAYVIYIRFDNLDPSRAVGD